MYTHRNMVGFARVTTDQAVFGWMSDVIIHPAYRTWQMEYVLDHPITNQLSRLALTTEVAHRLYENFRLQPSQSMVLRQDLD